MRAASSGPLDGFTNVTVGSSCDPAVTAVSIVGISIGRRRKPKKIKTMMLRTAMDKKVSQRWDIKKVEEVEKVDEVEEVSVEVI